VANVQELDEATFETAVVKSDKPVLVDFWAAWCGPCRMVGPIVEAIAARYEGKVGVGKVNVDDVPALANKFGIRSIPTLIIFKGGEPAERVVGVQTEDALATLLDKILAS
jgi:thioredoxin 1